jgi:hypothetical protein
MDSDSQMYGKRQPSFKFGPNITTILRNDSVIFHQNDCFGRQTGAVDASNSEFEAAGE